MCKSRANPNSPQFSSDKLEIISDKMLQSKQMTYYYFFWAVIVAVIVSLVHSQDFGFPEESGLAKDKQNANVS